MYAHPHFTVAEAVTSLTSPSSFVNALANEHAVNFTRPRQFHFTESTSGLFKCTRKTFPFFTTRTVAVVVDLYCLVGRTKLFIIILSQVSCWVISALVTW